MKNNWKEIKRIIKACKSGRDLFLTIIDEEGNIVCANAKMIRTLHLKDPRLHKINFFELLHPVHMEDFRKAIRQNRENDRPNTMELYLKNGYYHPMKWCVNQLCADNGDSIYLCVGNKILDDDRLRKFNDLGEKNYQLIVEGLNAGVLFQDKKGELIAANQKAAEIFNTTLERLYQLSNIAQLWNTAWTITTEAGDPVLFADTPFMRSLKTNQAQTEILVIQLRNGENRWLHFSSQPLFEGNCSEPYAVVSNIVDVSQEKELSKKLREREALFNIFMKRTPNMAWVVDEDSKLVFASSSFYKYFGLEEKKAINRSIMDIIPPVVANGLLEKHIKVLETGQSIETVEEVKWADGTNFIFHINIFPIDGVSEKRMLGGHAVNLAEKYAVEKKLRETNERMLLLTRATSDAIWEWDMQTGQIFRNDALMDMIGYQGDDPKGLSWWLRRIHPDDRNRVSDKVKESTEKNLQSWEEEYLFKCADGTYKQMRDKGYIVYENGLPVKMIGSLQDITNLRVLENRLTEEKLERQKEISEMVIRVQEKERTRIGYELHDNVNQILSTTKLFVDMLNPVDKEQKELKKKSIDYILLAIEEIRKLSKELVVPQLKEKGLVDSIEGLIDDIHLSTPLKIKFTHDHDSYLLSPGKKVTLFRIVQEQLKNILKHSQATQVDILLQSRDNGVQLIIRDNGIGFDARQTRRGIGLSNIYERTRFYNGISDIQTFPGKGCTLEVMIPLTH